MTFELSVEPQEKMSVVFVGHVDHGKSTVVGRLLADTGSLPQGKLEQVKANCERNSKPFEYAFLIDALKDEQAQGITIDAARVFFKSQKRNYIIIDAPGHIEFLKNMVTGASRAEAALLVIDAQEGIQENSRRHGYLLWMLGIKKIVVLINKMDLVEYSEKVFNEIRRDYDKFLKEIGVEPEFYIPVSGMQGDDIMSLSSNMPWYSGHTVLSALDSFEKEPPLVDKPLRMPVQDVYKFTSFGDDRRIIAGRIVSGELSIGDEIIFYPSVKKSRIKTIEGFNLPPKAGSRSGRSTGFTLEEQIYIQRGEIAAKANEPAPAMTTRLRASIFWLGKKPMSPKKEYFLKVGTAKVRVRIESILTVIDSSDLGTNQKQQIDRLDVAECILRTNKAIAFDLAGDIPDTSRFVIIDDYEITGGGIILESLPDTQTWVRESVIMRNYKWEKSMITPEQRAEQYSQKSALVLITGQKGVGRKRIAKLLESNLFSSGKMVYYLGLGNVKYGVDADIRTRSAEETHQEHIRRLAEVAHILMDAGFILIITAIELTQSDLEIIKTAVDSSRIETIWIGDAVTTDLAFDSQLPGGEEIEQSVIQIKRLLQDHGIIFNPM